LPTASAAIPYTHSGALPLPADPPIYELYINAPETPFNFETNPLSKPARFG
jgi:hypothetical protein